MPLTTEQKALVIRVWKYYDKHKEMIAEYKKPETKTLAVDSYGRIFPIKKARYERAWKFMPDNYEARMTAIDDRIFNWIKKFSKKMFGVVLTDDEVRSIVEEIKRKAV